MVETGLRVVVVIAIGALGGLMFGAGARDSGKMLQTVGAYPSLDPWPRAEGAAVRGATPPWVRIVYVVMSVGRDSGSAQQHPRLPATLAW